MGRCRKYIGTPPNVTQELEIQEELWEDVPFDEEQDKTFVEKFYTEFKKNFKYSRSYYSKSDLEALRVLKESLRNQFPDSIPELENMYDHMITANEADTKENK